MLQADTRKPWALSSAAATASSNFVYRAGASAVVANTLPALVASHVVLLKTGFTKIRVLHDLEEDEVWCYRLERPLD